MTHASMYLNSQSHHRLAQKHSIMSTLVHREKCISGADPTLLMNLQDWEQCSWRNGYCRTKIECVIAKHRKRRSTPTTCRGAMVIPYCGTITNRLSSLLLHQRKIKSISRPSVKIKQLMKPVKDTLGLNVPGVYKIPCACRFYITQENVYQAKIAQAPFKIRGQWEICTILQQLEYRAHNPVWK